MARRGQVAYLSGAITGTMWWPQVTGGRPVRQDMRGHFGFWQKGDSFRDALNSLLCREGGDFQGAAFTADTVLRIERRYPATRGYVVQVWEREIAELPDCGDLVDPEVYSSDFFGDD